MRAPLVLLILLLLVLPALPNSAHADTQHAPYAWTLDETPRAGRVDAIAATPIALLAVAHDGRLLRSLDHGDTWAEVAGMDGLGKARLLTDPATSGRVYLAGLDGVWRSDDHGATWQHVLVIDRAARIDVAPDGRVLVGGPVVGDDNGLLVSDDAGATWTRIDDPLPDDRPVCGVAFGRSDAELLVQNDLRSWYSHDDGATWTETPDNGVEFLVPTPGEVWRIDMGIIQRTLDGGQTWLDVDPPGLAASGGIDGQGGVYLAATSGLLHSTDGGATWTNRGHGDVVFDAKAVIADPADATAALVADRFVGVARIDATGTYAGLHLPLAPAAIEAIDIGPHGAMAAVGPGGLWRHDADAGTWHHTGFGRGGISDLHAVAIAGDALYVGGLDLVGSPVVAANDDGTNNFTLHWLSRMDARVADVSVDDQDPRRAVVAVEQTGIEQPIFETSDGGTRWARVLTLPGHAGRIDLAHRDGGETLVASRLGLFARLDTQWTTVPVEPLVGLATDGVAIAAAGHLQHWVDAGLRDAPLMAVNPGDAPTAVTALDIDAGGDAVWSASDAVWRCSYRENTPCISVGLDGADLRDLAHDDTGRVWAATPWGLWSASV